MTETLTLDALRQKIDEIDNQLLTKLAERQNLSRAIVKQKVLGSDVFRPDREASLLRNLQAGHPHIGAKLIFALWRQIISASIAEQKPDYLILHTNETATLSHGHAAGFLKEKQVTDAEEALSLVADGQADCAIITQADLDRLASHLGASSQLYIVAKLPFASADTASITGYIIARSLPGPSGDDFVVYRDAAGQLCHRQGYPDAEFLQDASIIGIYATPLSL